MNLVIIDVDVICLTASGTSTWRAAAMLECAIGIFYVLVLWRYKPSALCSLSAVLDIQDINTRWLNARREPQTVLPSLLDDFALDFERHTISLEWRTS